MSSAAPLEGAYAASDIAQDMNYQTSIESGGTPEVLKDKLTPKAIVAALEHGEVHGAVRGEGLHRPSMSAGPEPPVPQGRARMPGTMCHFPVPPTSLRA